MRHARSAVKSVFHALGYDIRRTHEPRLGGRRFPSDPFLAQRDLLQTKDPADVIIFDVGANRGQSAETYRSKLKGAQIYCFEAIPKLQSELETKFAADPMVQVVPKAVGKENCRSTFYINDRAATSSLFPRPTGNRRYYPKGAVTKNKVEVDVVTLDSFARDNEISSIDILKLDVQGGELDALYGATSILQSCAVSIVYTEIMFVPHYEGTPLFHEICKYLSTYGYSLFDIYDLHRAMNGQLRYGDALFVSPLVRENAINNYPAEP